MNKNLPLSSTMCRPKKSRQGMSPEAPFWTFGRNRCKEYWSNFCSFATRSLLANQKKDFFVICALMQKDENVLAINSKRRTSQAITYWWTTVVPALNNFKIFFIHLLSTINYRIQLIRAGRTNSNRTVKQWLHKFSVLEPNELKMISFEMNSDGHTLKQYKHHWERRSLWSCWFWLKFYSSMAVLSRTTICYTDATISECCCLHSSIRQIASCQ